MRVPVICFLLSSFYLPLHSQVDTTLLYNPNTKFGMLDVRLSRGTGHHYYLEENKTFSFRMNGGVPTNTFLNMTAWESSPYAEGNMRQRDASGDMFVMNYRLLPPGNYRPEFSRGYPLVIVLHGLLERGNCADKKCYHADDTFSPNENSPPASTALDNALLNNDYSLIHAGLDYLEARNTNGSRLPDDPALPAGAFPGFVLFPQNLNGWDATSSEDVVRLIRLMISRYNIDEDRVYINGISHGGHGAYEVMKRAPWLFAAGILFSAADDAAIIQQGQADKISGIPLWIFQGGRDVNPTQSRTESYVRAFRKAGATVRYTLYDGLGHGTWNKALDEPDFFSWLLAQKRNNIHVQNGKAIICSTSGAGAKLMLPEGFVKYQWEYNGSLAVETTSGIYVAENPGVYRARYMANDEGPDVGWSNWSDPVNVTVMSVQTPRLEQIGTLLLPDLNMNRNAQLAAVADFPLYYWYRNGELVKELGDTSRVVTLTPKAGSGAYTLRVAGYDLCKSPESRVMHVVFDNGSPVSLATPNTFRGTSISPSTISLTWSDASEGETGFEIWRRKKHADGNYSPWVMIAITEANASLHTDKGVHPGSVYFYKIRAISNMTRSHYLPGAEDEIVVNTPVDLEAPTVPIDLTATQTGVNAIRLSWKPSKDNAGIGKYVITYSGDSAMTQSADTAFTLNDLALNSDYSFTVKAVDLSGNVSPKSNVAQANTYMTGLYYEHSTGVWEGIAAVDWSVKEFSGKVNDFTLAPRTQQDFFNFFFDGYLNIETAGVYQFRLTSDDGSILSLNDTLLIANDGIHTINTVTSPVQILAAGPHRIAVKYFDYQLSDTLLVGYKGPDSNNEWVKIPAEALASRTITATERASQSGDDFEIELYPNPVRDNRILIRLNSSGNDPGTIVIRDMRGAVVYESDFDGEADPEVRLPFDFESGIYILTVKQASRYSHARFLHLPD